MNDHDLQEMFRRREPDVTMPAPPPEKVVRRARRRQVGTVVIAATVAIALVAVPLAGLRLLRTDTDDGPTPGEASTVVLPETSDGLRSAALPYASIAYPNGWFLTDTSPLIWMGPAQPAQIISGPVLQLSSFDPDLHDAPRCTFDADPIPDDGVLLTVSIQAAGDAPIAPPTDPWPVELGPYPPNSSPQCDQGVSLTVGWVAPSGAYYWAHATFGSDSTDSDRAAIRAAFASMIFPPSGEAWMSTFAADQGQGSPRLVLDSAVFDGVPVTLVTFLDHYKAPQIGVSAPVGNFIGGSAIGVGTGSGEPPPVEVTSTGGPTGTVVFGDAALEVARAEFNTQEGQTVPAEIVTIPSSVGVGRNAVWGSVDGPGVFVQGIGYDEQGDVLGDAILTTAPPDVIASGTEPGVGDWTLSITHETIGDGLTFSSDNGGSGSCCFSDKTFDDDVLQLDGYSMGGTSVITAFAAPQVASVTGQFSGSTFDGQLFPMPTKYLGPAQIVVVFVPEGISLNGSLIASNEDGDVLAMVPVDGGPAEEPGGPTPVSGDGSGPATGVAGSGDVVATGTDVVGGPWTLTITHEPAGDGIAFEWVDYVNASGTGCCLHNVKIGNHDLVFDSMGWTAGAPTVILAFASTRTAKVASEIDGVTYEAQLYPLPARYLGPLQIAVLLIPAKEPEDVRAPRLVAYNAQGAVLEAVT